MRQALDEAGHLIPETLPAYMLEQYQAITDARGARRCAFSKRYRAC